MGARHHTPRPPSPEQLAAIGERLALRDDGVLVWRKHLRRTGMRVGSLDIRNGYRRVKMFGRLFAEHHIVWFLHHGAWPSQPIDHINGDRADNRPSNLRMVSHAENCRGFRWRAEMAHDEAETDELVERAARTGESLDDLAAERRRAG